MDVSKSNSLNDRKLAADASWNAMLNRAKSGPAKDDSFMGVTRAATLQNAKMSDLPAANARDAFARALDMASDKRQPLDEEKRAELEKTSTTLVNQFFMGSMLKQMRESPFKIDMFGGGKGGDAYAGLFDQHIAENAGNGIARSLVKSMVKQYARTVSNVGGGGIS